MIGTHEDNGDACSGPFDQAQYKLGLTGVAKTIELLPEQTGYRDDGCYVHPHCLTCPLPHCIYDEPDGGRAMLKELRDQKLLDAYHKEGLDVDTLAQRFGISKRSVYRIISQSREHKKRGVQRG
ncbi:MAG: sigma-70 family RNA polymerase sigma factor [Dehalococcoidia bacterium]|nr:sigma-70 family RNA polymerase sigma factor [Dehalococcoidia bacterium]